MVAAGLETPLREELLADFHDRYAGNALVIDKWFSLQAQSLHPDALAHVKALAHHPDFTIRNPNRVRALYMAFAVNPHAFHAADGEGYRMIADLIVELDPLNAQTAARFVPQLGRWRRIEPRRAGLMRGELERIAAASKLSADTSEQVTRALADAVEVVRSDALAGVPHGFLGRKGGVSTGLVAGLNVGFGAGDDPAASPRIAAGAAEAVLPGAPLVAVHQVHSAICVTAAEPWDDAHRPTADALATARPGTLIGIVTADCAPILFADAEVGVIGAAHAGWRGAHGGVAEATLAAMEALGARRERIAAAIGPAIEQASYEVARISAPILPKRTPASSLPGGPAITSSISKPMSPGGLPRPGSDGSKSSASIPIPMPALLLVPPRDPSRRAQLRAAILADRLALRTLSKNRS